jgi:hypothetical protein
MSYRMLANGMVGSGFSYRGFEAGLARKPDLIGCDAGTADFGPGPLGSGEQPKSRIYVERDLRLMLRGARERKVPLVIGSSGGAGGEPHLEEYRDLVLGIAHDESLHFRLALIHAEQDPAQIARELHAGRVTPLGPVPELTEEAVASSSRIVAMMGAGPLISALDSGADVILAGRCADPAIFACGPIRAGLPLAQSWHAAKSIDKGAMATTKPREGSPVLATVDENSFVVEATKANSECSVETVAGITLHENPDPWAVAQPSGVISTRSSVYTQVGSQAVRVEHSQFHPAEKPSVKLEGARLVGYRSLLIAGIRDPRLLAKLDEFLDALRTLVGRVAASVGFTDQEYTLRFLTYGRDAVLGELEPHRDSIPQEIGLIVDVVAREADTAHAIASRVGPIGSRFDFTGSLGGGANFAYPFSLPIVDMGPVYEWSLWHVLAVSDESDPFTTEWMDV